MKSSNEWMFTIAYGSRESILYRGLRSGSISRWVNFNERKRDTSTGQLLLFLRFYKLTLSLSEFYFIVRGNSSPVMSYTRRGLEFEPCTTVRCTCTENIVREHDKTSASKLHRDCFHRVRNQSHYAMERRFSKYRSRADFGWIKY